MTAREQKPEGEQKCRGNFENFAFPATQSIRAPRSGWRAPPRYSLGKRTTALVRNSNLAPCYHSRSRDRLGTTTIRAVAQPARHKSSNARSTARVQVQSQMDCSCGYHGE